MSGGCLSECVWEPPPDLAPPPPIPTFLRHPVETIAAHNGSCNLCQWASFGDDTLRVTRTYNAMDDVWYFVIVSGIVGLLFIAILLLLLMLRCKQKKMKNSQQPINQVHKLSKGYSFNPESSSRHYLPNPHIQRHLDDKPYEEKAVWSALYQRDASGSYVLQHHIFNQDCVFDSRYPKIGYGSAAHAPGAQRPLPGAPIDEVHFTPKGPAYYAHPADAGGAFDNSAFDDSEAKALIARKTTGSKLRAGSHRLPRVQTTQSGPMDHLVIKDGAGPHLPMVTQLHCDRIRSTALV